jgi:hypothetical protein
MLKNTSKKFHSYKTDLKVHLKYTAQFFFLVFTISLIRSGVSSDIKWFQPPSDRSRRDRTVILSTKFNVNHHSTFTLHDYYFFLSYLLHGGGAQPPCTTTMTLYIVGGFFRFFLNKKKKNC